MHVFVWDTFQTSQVASPLANSQIEYSSRRRCRWNRTESFNGRGFKPQLDELVLNSNIPFLELRGDASLARSI